MEKGNMTAHGREGRACLMLFLLGLCFLPGCGSVYGTNTSSGIQWEYAELRSSVNGTLTWSTSEQMVAAVNWDDLLGKLGMPRENMKQGGRLHAVTIDYLGSQGWELVSHNPVGGNWEYLVFKRRR